MLMNKTNGQQDSIKQESPETVVTKSSNPSSVSSSTNITNVQKPNLAYTNLKESTSPNNINNMSSTNTVNSSNLSTNSNSSASSTASCTSVDVNNNSNITNNNTTNSSASNPHSAVNQYQQQLAHQNSLINAYSMLNNPYINGTMLNNSTQLNSQQNQLLSNLNTTYGTTNGLNFGLNTAGIQPSQINSTQANSINTSNTGLFNLPNANFLNNVSSTSNGVNLNDEHQVYEYLHQLLEEKEKLKELFNEPFNIMLPISAKLLDEEVSRIRVNLFQLGGKESIMLPEPVGQVIQMTEKLYVPVKDHPEFNFVGRILGPRGMTAKQLEQETGCKIMVRGKGSMRDKAKEDQMKGKPNWEHLSDDLHVLLTVEDTKNRCEAKLKKAGEEIKRLLVPAAEGEDELKKKQLMELAIINGTYRDGSKLQNKMNQILIPHNGLTSTMPNSNIRSPPNQMGQPLIISPRLQNPQLLSNGTQPQQFITSSTDAAGQLIYTTLPTVYSSEQQNQLINPQLLEYPNGIELSQAGSIKPQRFSAVGTQSMRAHPYARVI